MTRCLDEGKLQSYFDGELSIEMMETVTAHLASCATCAAAARELEEESALLMSALTAEFGSNVPTERLRERIDAAVFGDRIAVAPASGKATGLAGFFAGLLNFGTQRTLGYASLAVVLAFAAIMAVVKMNGTNNKVAVVSTPAAKPAAAPVKLLPGERSYLQAIARLDTTIKSNKKAMRPSLQVEYERNLAVVDRAIVATRTAAKSNPNDSDAADFMFAAYQSKVDLLNTIADARLGGGRGH